MSPLVMALIFFLAWRQSRRLGQAFADTAAWVVGYLGTYSAIVVLHFGRPSMVSLNPESLWTIVPILGGFLAMKLSHWLWRRRGGHLQPAVHPFAAKHWMRALRAALFGGRPRTSSTSTTTAARATTVSTPRQASSTTPSAPATAAGVPARTAARTPSNKWVRVARAMLDTEGTRNRTRR